MVPKWSRSCPELVLSGPERCFAVRRPRGGSEVVPKWSRSGPELVLSGPERCFAVSGWAESGPEIVVPKWPRAGFERSGAVFCCLGVVLKRPRSGWPSQSHSELHLEGYLEVSCGPLEAHRCEPAGSKSSCKSLIKPASPKIHPI